MYENFFALEENPFTLSPDPKYFYFSPIHEEGYSKLIYSISQGYGFMALIGEIGTGKTTLINAIINKLPQKFITAIINQTIATPKAFIQNMFHAFGYSVSNATFAELSFKLRDYLKSLHVSGRKSILIIDEAQNLSKNILEQVRLLSNFEAVKEKYLQIVLIGQPELHNKLNANDLRQLRERINYIFYLKQLDLKETSNYINHRLKVAGLPKKDNLFNEDVIKKIHDHSRGIPRLINILCDKSLLTAYLNDTKLINDQIFEEVLESNHKDIARPEIQIPVESDHLQNKSPKAIHPQKHRETPLTPLTPPASSVNKSFQRTLEIIEEKVKKIQSSLDDFVFIKKSLFLEKFQAIFILITLLFSILSFLLIFFLSVRFGIFN
jgi:general secretion pathway protein A